MLIVTDRRYHGGGGANPHSEAVRREAEEAHRIAAERTGIQFERDDKRQQMLMMAGRGHRKKASGPRLQLGISMRFSPPKFMCALRKISRERIE